MSRLIACALVAAARVAYADDAPSTTASTPDTADSDTLASEQETEQGIGASLGVAGGSANTAGGLRIGGHYLYKLSATDWFAGTATFTFGGGDPGCFRDRMDLIVCEHGLADGASGELGVNVRRYFSGQKEFRPYARLGVGVALVRYSNDELTGIALPFHAGGGLRVGVADGIAVIAEAVIDLGFGGFTRELGLEPYLGGSVTAGVDFRL